MNEKRTVNISNSTEFHEIRGKITGQGKEYPIKPDGVETFHLKPKETLRLKSYSEGVPAIPANCPVAISFEYGDGVDVSMEWNENKEEWKLKVKQENPGLIKDPKDVNVTIGEPNA